MDQKRVNDLIDHYKVFTLMPKCAHILELRKDSATTTTSSGVTDLPKSGQRGGFRYSTIRAEVKRRMPAIYKARNRTGEDWPLFNSDREERAWSRTLRINMEEIVYLYTQVSWRQRGAEIGREMYEALERMDAAFLADRGTSSSGGSSGRNCLTSQEISWEEIFENDIERFEKIKFT